MLSRLQRWLGIGSVIYLLWSKSLYVIDAEVPHACVQRTLIRSFCIVSIIVLVSRRQFGGIQHDLRSRLVIKWVFVPSFQN